MAFIFVKFAEFKKDTMGGARLKKKQNIRFLSFFCQMTLVCLLCAEPHPGAVEVTVSHLSRTPAFIELTFMHKPVSR